MSWWISIDGTISTTKPKDVVESTLAAKLPEGSEGPTKVRHGGEEYPNEWWIDGDLRDRGDEDVPGVVGWFLVACAVIKPDAAHLNVKVGTPFSLDSYYRLEWQKDRVVLLVPSLYQKALDEGWAVIEEVEKFDWEEKA